MFPLKIVKFNQLNYTVSKECFRLYCMDRRYPTTYSQYNLGEFCHF